MTTVMLSIQALLVFLLVDYLYPGVIASTITIPDFGFEKGSLEFIQVTQNLEWQKATDVCKKDHQGHLVRVNTIEERDQLLEFVDSHSVDNHFWVGLQWSNGAKLWDDGTCTAVNSAWDWYKDSSHSTFQNAAQCYAAHDTKKLQWEAFSCKDKKHFVCEKRSNIVTTDVNIDFHVILQNETTKAVCTSLCKTLDQCFLSSAIQNACIVGLASNQPNSNVIILGAPTGQTVSLASSSAATTQSPPDCTEEAASGAEAIKTLANYTLIHGNWQAPTVVQATPHTCPSASPLVNHIYVTETLTEISTHVSTTREFVEVNTCTAISAGVSTVIQPTTVTEVMTSVDIQTTTVPTYVTVTSHVAASSCAENSIISAIYTTTVNSCHPSSSSTGTSVTSSSSQTSGVSSESTVTVNSEISEEFRMEVEALLLDKYTLSKTIRSKNSANNRLVSSVAIGFSFSLLCVIFIAVIILSDLRSIWVHIKTRMWVNIRSLTRSF